MHVFLLNRDQQHELAVDVTVTNRQFAARADVTVLGGVNLQATNSWEDPRHVVPRCTEAAVTEAGSVRLVVPAPGLAVVRTGLDG